eukprot:jgi/Undpi1/12214/HiC_scaffold_5.g01890.m1
METSPLLKGQRAAGSDGGLEDHDGLRSRSNMAPPYSGAAVFAVFFFPALGGLLFGYDIGATSSVLTQLESSTYSDVSWYTIVKESTLLQGVITSNGVLGAIIGSLICFKVGDYLGRRRELLISAVLFFFGSVVEALSGSSYWSGSWGLVVLMIGRVFYGIGCGFAMHGAPAYIGEMSPSAVRGVLVSMKEAMIVVGMLLGYSLGWVLDDTAGGWRWTYGVASVPAVAMLVGMYGMPPSARWLVFSGRIDAARKSLQFVTPGISELAVAEIQASAEKTQGQEAGFDVLMGPTCKNALIVGLGLVTLQQITGQPSVLYYADTIFEDVGLSSSSSVLVAAFKLLATLCAVFTVDKHGRVKLLTIGCSLMFVALLILTVSFMFDYVSEEDCNDYTLQSSCSAYSDKCEWDTGCSCSSSSGSDTSSSSACTCCGVTGLDLQKGCILGAMFLYIGGYQVGFGPVVWLIISEIFPLDVRGKAISVAVVANFTWNLVVTLVFPTELDIIGSSLTFGVFALIDAYALYFIRKKVPETKGLSLEQIEALFMRRGQRDEREALARS